MRANITAFVDTLLAAMTMSRGGAMAIVLGEMAAVTAISLAALVFASAAYERAMLATVEWLTARQRSLALFVAGLIALPAALLLVSRALA